jgi:transposase
VALGKFWCNPTTQKWVRWQERSLVVYSTNVATAQRRGLHQRLDQAQTALDKLVAKPGNELESLDAKVAAILKRHRVQAFFSVTTAAQTVTQKRSVGRGRPAANAPTQQVTQMQLHLQFSRQAPAIEQAEQLAGWRLYRTNAPLTQLSLPQAILDYRDQWLLERGFHRFKRSQLPALPLYFQHQDRIVGLMFLLTLALRVFTLIEFAVRLA